MGEPAEVLPADQVFEANAFAQFAHSLAAIGGVTNDRAFVEQELQKSVWVFVWIAPTLTKDTVEKVVLRHRAAAFGRTDFCKGAVVPEEPRCRFFTRFRHGLAHIHVAKCRGGGFVRVESGGRSRVAIESSIPFESLGGGELVRKNRVTILGGPFDCRRTQSRDIDRRCRVLYRVRKTLQLIKVVELAMMTERFSRPGKLDDVELFVEDLVTFFDVDTEAIELVSLVAGRRPIRCGLPKGCRAWRLLLRPGADA